MEAEKLTPKTVANYLKANFSNRGGLKSVFAAQFLSKFDLEQLEALKVNIEEEIQARYDAIAQEKIAEVEKLGYKVIKA
ncbi:MAG: hypothetical protein ACK4KT_05190 [Thermaurantimonas sp.]